MNTVIFVGTGCLLFSWEGYFFTSGFFAYGMYLWLRLREVPAGRLEAFAASFVVLLILFGAGSGALLFLGEIQYGDFPPACNPLAPGHIRL